MDEAASGSKDLGASDKDPAAGGKDPGLGGTGRQQPAAIWTTEDGHVGRFHVEAAGSRSSAKNSEDQEHDDVFKEPGVHLKDKAARDDALYRRRRQMQRAASSASLLRRDADPYYSTVSEGGAGVVTRHRPHPPKLVRIGSVSDLAAAGQPPRQYRVVKDGQKTLLQFALPQNPAEKTTSFSRPTSVNDFGTFGYNMASPPGSVVGSQTELFHRGPPPRLAYVNPIMSASDPDISDHLHDGFSVFKGGAEDDDGDDPPPTSSEEKTQVFGEYLITTLSLIYAVLLFVLGFVLYIGDIGTEIQGMASGYNLFLVAVSFLYLLFLFIDVTIYRGRVIQKEKFDRKIREAEIECVESARGNLELAIQLPPDMRDNLKELPLHYNFATGRHAGSLYLKIGAGVFCFGHLIHCILLLVYHISYFFSNDEEVSECANVLTLLFDIVYPIYSFFLLFFIFKYSHVMIHRYKALAVFAIIHCLAASMCFWMWAIIRETMDYISSYVRGRYGDAAQNSSSYYDNGDSDKWIFNEADLVRNYCPGPPQMAVIRDNISPYLYPFTIEYSIIVAGILYVVWHNIGAEDEHGSRDSDAESTMTDSSRAPISSGVISSHLMIAADCRASQKGLLLGMLLLMVVVVNVIFVHVAYSSDILDTGLVVTYAVELGLLASLVVAATWAYFVYFRKLDVNHHPVSMLDDMLLLVCMPAFFLYVITSLVPAVLAADVLKIMVMLVTLVQVVMQTPFIIDGLRRCSNSPALRKRKPGRELITFLIVVNVAMWIDETFDLKSYDMPDVRYDFYGKALWAILKHATIPLIVFYRFHASVCFVDIWQSAYVKGS